MQQWAMGHTQTLQGGGRRGGGHLLSLPQGGRRSNMLAARAAAEALMSKNGFFPSNSS